MIARICQSNNLNFSLDISKEHPKIKFEDLVTEARKLKHLLVSENLKEDKFEFDFSKIKHENAIE